MALEHPVSATPASEITSERVLLSFGFVATFLHVAYEIRGAEAGRRRSAFLLGQSLIQLNLEEKGDEGRFICRPAGHDA